MANIFTNFLDTISGDLINTNLKDYKHASRLFVQNFYRLAPKHGFLYFVRFKLNPNVADSTTWNASLKDLELGMLVKKCDLPKISLDGSVVNIYNRKQPVYTKVTYQPINMTLHDDNSGLVRDFWQMYYQYHVADSYYGAGDAKRVPPNATNRYKKPTPVKQEQLEARSNVNASNYVNTTDTARYGLDTSVSEPLIRSIEIYQLSRKTFFLHTLVNPKIRTWNMDTVASDSKNPMEHQVSIEYEGVYFGKGKITRYNPDGWTDLHYDLDPSPIGGIFGRSDGGLLGPNGLIADGTQLFEDLQGMQNNPNYSTRDALATLFKSARLIGNASNLNTDLARQQVQQATINSVGFVIINETTGTVSDLSIPRGSTNNATSATAVKGVTSTGSTTTLTTGGETPDAGSTTVRSN